jgi:quinol monooxygenase YgiN
VSGLPGLCAWSAPPILLVSLFSYDICHSPSSAELLINQQWATQSGLDEFYASAEFARATPQFAGQLAGPPEERVYHPV